ncbi:MAG: hypothetical protein ACLQU1_38350 [Bryobacteraceae bacterium]
MAAHTRRGLLKTAAALLPSLSAASWRAALCAPKSVRITDVILDLNDLHKWDNSHGDTWDPFWADDDNLYAFNCDGRGFGKSPRNLAFNRLLGDSPSTLSGAMINTMDEYGGSGKKEADNATWKVCGQECIDSIFYAFVSRNVYGKDSGDYWLRQTAFNSSLVKSTDKGLTWSRGAVENYNRPMWPGPSFGAPFFIHYGKNGGDVAQDGARRYVYAVSTNGFWNDGDRYILGRVSRERLPDLKAADWGYFSGGDGNQAKSWSLKVEEAQPLLDLRTHCGQSGPCYIPALGLYLMVVWYNTEKMIKWYEPNEMRYDFYQAPHPWGPWTSVRSYSDAFLSPGHMYGPSLCAKFQRREGPDVHMTLFTSGCPFKDVPEGLYKAWEIPVVVKTAPVIPSTLIPSGDPRIVYNGRWTSSSEDRLSGPVHQTASANDSAELSFRGAGIDFLADKKAGFGSVAIFLDGVLAHTAALGIENLPRLNGVTVFRSGGLKNGAHSIRVVNQTSSPVVVDGFQVYGG